MEHGPFIDVYLLKMVIFHGHVSHNQMVSGSTSPEQKEMTKLSNDIQSLVYHLSLVKKSILPGWWYTFPSEKYEFVSWVYYHQ